MTARFDQQVTFLYTEDLEAATVFYRDLLALPQVLDQGMCRIFSVTAEAFVGVCHDPERAAEPGGVIVTLVTDDVDGWHRRLVADGAVFERDPVYNERFDIYHCFLRDPDGHLVEIQQFRDPAWPRV